MDDRTIEAFHRLPLTVSLAEFSDWIGLDRWSVMAMRRAGQIATIKVGSRHKYLKSEIARLARLPLSMDGARSIRRTDSPHD